MALLSGRADPEPRGKPTDSAAEPEGSETVRMWRYLPLAVLATGSVIVLPGIIMAALVPVRGALSTVVCAVLAMAASLAVARAEAAIWARRRGSRELLFADLMLWGWVRRCRAERGLARTQELYESARKAGPGVSIDLLQRLNERLEARDAYTHGHSRRVARHAGSIARAMRLSPTEIAKICTAATVHDIGKLYTPREILNNPGRLTDKEFAIVKLHPGDGAEMLAEVGDSEIAAMVRHHHERIDGHGYPDGLAGSEIPLGARIIAVADTFDAITSARAYRRASTHKKALDVLSRESGSQLDRAAVAAFLRGYSPRRSLAVLAFATAIPARVFAGLQAASSSIGVGIAGTTSILPAVGAAGLFAFAPGLQHGTPAAQSPHRKPAIAFHRLTIPAPLTTTATRPIRRVASIHPASHAHHEHHGGVRTSPRTTAPKRTTTPITHPVPHESATSPPAQTPPVSQPPEVTTTTETPPPAVEVPTLPEPPVNLPVEVPSVPGVPLPGVK